MEKLDTYNQFLISNFRVYVNPKFDAAKVALNTVYAHNGVVIISDPNVDNSNNRRAWERANQLFGYDYESMNATLHKSFLKVRNMSSLEYDIEQMMHYFSTYGREAFGLEAIPWIPEEVLAEDPTLQAPRFTLIKEISVDEMVSMLKAYIQTGCALKSHHLTMITGLFEYFSVPFSYEEWEGLNNREAKLMFGDLYHYVPKDAEEFIKYVAYSYTGESCIVKNSNLWSRLKCNNYSDSDFTQMVKSFCDINPDGLKMLSKHFNRYKTVFLALRHKNKANATIVNKIAKLSKKYHEPVHLSILDRVTSLENFNDDEVAHNLLNAIGKATTSRLVRLANAIAYKLKEPTVAKYQIRNGSAFVKEIDKTLSSDRKTFLENIYELILVLINVRLCEKLNTEEYEEFLTVIPQALDVAVPTSEKVFVGDIPSGSVIKVKPEANNLVVGVHWYDINEKRRVDLDLHCYNNTSHISWNHSKDNDAVTFSGDCTAAPLPHGAAEYMNINLESMLVGDSYTLDLSLFNLGVLDGAVENISFRFFIATKDSINEDYIIDPSKVIYDYNSNIASENVNLGTFFKNEDGELLFRFDNHLRKSSIPSNDKFKSMERDVDMLKTETTLRFSQLFDHLYVNPKELTKTKLLDLFL